MEYKRINFETAKLAKDIGFDWPVDNSFTHYLNENKHSEDGTTGPFGWEKDEIEETSGYFKNFWDKTDYSNKYYICYARPTQAQLHKFLRKVYQLEVLVYCNRSGWLWELSKAFHKDHLSGGTHITWSQEKGPNLAGQWDEYEDAMEDGFDSALNYIKKEDLKKIEYNES